MQRGGGLADDVVYGLAVSGSIYVAGIMANNNTNDFAVSFGAGNVQCGIARGSNGTGSLLGGSFDMVLVKYVAQRHLSGRGLEPGGRRHR